ncbi:MAG: hypothetical protein LKI93_03635 [Bifidobacteriaceae bacterium]|jgi:hypothetical protein|nr:hypothetical protein [Bifidobacteriaceae bacterium]MCI1915312.1 hypothetical protein [Bifidobacteriaceae bacterium]
MSGLLGSFVFRLSTDSFDLPTNEIRWTANGNNHIDVEFAFRPEAKATIDETDDGLNIRVWSDQLPGKEAHYHLGTDPSHDEVVNVVGCIFTAALNLHREFKKDSWLDI